MPVAIAAPGRLLEEHGQPAPVQRADGALDDRGGDPGDDGHQPATAQQDRHAGRDARPAQGVDGPPVGVRCGEHVVQAAVGVLQLQPTAGDLRGEVGDALQPLVVHPARAHDPHEHHRGHALGVVADGQRGEGHVHLAAGQPVGRGHPQHGGGDVGRRGAHGHHRLADPQAQRQRRAGGGRVDPAGRGPQRQRLGGRAGPGDGAARPVGQPPSPPLARHPRRLRISGRAARRPTGWCRRAARRRCRRRARRGR